MEGQVKRLPRSHFRLGAFESRHYSRAPITEAIISLNIEMPTGFDVPRLKSFAEVAKVPYAPVGEERMLGFSASLDEGAISTQGTNITGFRFASGDGKYAITCRANSFSLSRLAPYETWETFRDEARRLWGGFRETYEISKVTGLSVRYVNRIEIPWKQGEQIDFKWYFRTFPEVSSDLDIGMAGFFMRLDIPLTGLDARLILNQAMLPPASPQPESISVLLDFDVVSGSAADTEEGIWVRYEILRKAKNDAFEACITNQSRELFQ